MWDFVLPVHLSIRDALRNVKDLPLWNVGNKEYVLLWRKMSMTDLCSKVKDAQTVYTASLFLIFKLLLWSYKNKNHINRKMCR